MRAISWRGGMLRYAVGFRFSDGQPRWRGMPAVDRRVDLSLVRPAVDRSEAPPAGNGAARALPCVDYGAGGC